MLMFYIIELYYIVCFSMPNRTFYVNKNSVGLSVMVYVEKNPLVSVVYTKIIQK